MTSWRRRFSFTPGRRAGRDWNFETPGMVPGGETPSTVKLPKNGDYELYEYPARALDATSNERASKLRMQSVEADHEALTGTSTVRTLAPGAKLTLYDVAHPEYAFETAAVLSISHHASDTTYETGPGQPSYLNRFTALPARLGATPHRATHRPRIEGSQIAIIAGPEGEEIHTDQYGRVKLWFPWDRRAKKDGSDTKWVRVAQPWAGGSWGAQVIPRIGMEAVVSFEGGDPDRPIVTALVPNPQQKVPYELPRHKTKSVFRTKTHKSSDWQRMNELSFEDETGLEEVYLHAQKDHNVHVGHNYSRRVDNSEAESIANNKTIEIGRHRNEAVGGNMRVAVGLNAADDVLTAFLERMIDPVSFKDASIANAPVWQDASLNFDMTSGKYELLVGGNKLEMVKLASAERVGISKTSDVRGFREDRTEGSHTAFVKQHWSTEVGGVVSFTSEQTISLRCGDSAIILNADGTVDIVGTEIRMRSTTGILLQSAIIDLNK